MSRAQLTSTVEQNTGGAVSPYVAGKNFVIGGGFDNWQRGTSFVSTGLAYTADRFQTALGTMTSGTITTTRQSAGLAGFNYALRFQRNSGATTTGNGYLTYSLDSLNTIALQGKTITVSFYARAGSNYSPSASGLLFVSNTGTGTDENINNGYSGQSTIGSTTTTLTTSWQRFSYTYSVSSTAQEIGFYWQYTGVGTAGANDYYDITGVQVEIGSVATPFARAGGTLSGELTACQRYYFATFPGDPTSSTFGVGNVGGIAAVNNQIQCNFRYPVTMRAVPTLYIYQGGTQNQVRNAANSSVSFPGPSTTGATTTGFAWIASSGTPLSVGVGYDFSLVGSAEL